MCGEANFVPGPDRIFLLPASPTIVAFVPSELLLTVCDCCGIWEDWNDGATEGVGVNGGATADGETGGTVLTGDGSGEG